MDSGAIDHFFRNQDLFSTYTKFKHKFKIGTREKITAHGYGNVELRIIDLTNIINTLTVTNISWAPELDHNLLTTIPLPKKSVKMFLRKASQLFKIIIDKEIFGLANIIEN